jgi:hypothetical protein
MASAWRGNLAGMKSAQQAAGNGGSFEMDRAEGGASLVSAELKERLATHGAADPETLQFLWKMNVWSVADLAGTDTEAMVHVSPPSPLSLACASPRARSRRPSRIVGWQRKGGGRLSHFQRKEGERGGGGRVRPCKRDTAAFLYTGTFPCSRRALICSLVSLSPTCSAWVCCCCRRGA